jgi:hypothetical protein
MVCGLHMHVFNPVQGGFIVMCALPCSSLAIEGSGGGCGSLACWTCTQSPAAASLMTQLAVPVVVERSHVILAKELESVPRGTAVSDLGRSCLLLN